MMQTSRCIFSTPVLTTDIDTILYYGFNHRIFSLKNTEGKYQYGYNNTVDGQTVEQYS